MTFGRHHFKYPFWKGHTNKQSWHKGHIHTAAKYHRHFSFECLSRSVHRLVTSFTPEIFRYSNQIVIKFMYWLYHRTEPVNAVSSLSFGNWQHVRACWHVICHKKIPTSCVFFFLTHSLKQHDSQKCANHKNKTLTNVIQYICILTDWLDMTFICKKMAEGLAWVSKHYQVIKRPLETFIHLTRVQNCFLCFIHLPGRLNFSLWLFLLYWCF